MGITDGKWARVVHIIGCTIAISPLGLMPQTVIAHVSQMVWLLNGVRPGWPQELLYTCRPGLFHPGQTPFSGQSIWDMCSHCLWPQMVWPLNGVRSGWNSHGRQVYSCCTCVKAVNTDEAALPVLNQVRAPVEVGDPKVMCKFVVVENLVASHPRCWLPTGEQISVAFLQFTCHSPSNKLAFLV